MKKKNVGFYDAIAFKGKWDSEKDKFLRDFSEEEKKISFALFGPLKKGITIFTGNGPTSCWYPETFSRMPGGGDHPIRGYDVACRAYANAPEFLPSDFQWEKIEEHDLYGGILKDATKRT